ncbi:hypothetical protein [Halogeometricum limi]|uniref:Uncharacterized protein n=1 Tax=Halogeometricum limi TaxID=555875 RepID=A0A1I6FQI4_9EURY|nr:hypothetical protein [Halogeometricum limi]SFR32210.1 hypothetical protein SAMN04488124_0080 [Halogeometricum limi]
MSPSELAGRLVAVLVAVEGLSVAAYGLLRAPAPGLGSLLAGEPNAFAAVGLLGVLLAAVALAVVFGRGRSAAVSLGGVLAVGGVVVLVVPVLSLLVAGLLLVGGLALVFAGASLRLSNSRPT